MQPTFQIVQQFSKVPEEVLVNFCNLYPWCGRQRLLSNHSERTLESLLLTGILEMSVTWATLSKLEQISLSIKQITASIDIPEVRQFLNNSNDHLQRIIANLAIPIKQTFITSHTERSRQIKSKVERDIAYINQLRNDEGMQDQLSSITRMLAMLMFLQESYKNLAPLNKLVQKHGKDVIVRALLMGQPLERVNPFILDDILILPISQQLQMPIYFFINKYDDDKIIPKRRIHAQNEEQTLVFLIDYMEEKKHQVLQLYSHNMSSLAVKELTSHMNKLYSQPISKVQSSTTPIQPAESQWKVLKGYFESTMERLVNQTVIECSSINEIWIQKINEIISDGITQPMRTKRSTLALQPDLVQSLKEVYAVMSGDDEPDLDMKDMLQNQLNFFESLVITQVTMVRDNLNRHIKSLQQPLKTEVTDKTDVNEQRNFKSITLFKKQKVPHLPQLTDQMKKSLQNSILINRIDAKFTEQELPDPEENHMMSWDEGIREIPSVKMAQIREYNTDDEQKGSSNEDEFPQQIINVDEYSSQNVRKSIVTTPNESITQVTKPNRKQKVLKTVVLSSEMQLIKQREFVEFPTDNISNKSQIKRNSFQVQSTFPIVDESKMNGVKEEKRNSFQTYMKSNKQPNQMESSYNKQRSSISAFEVEHVVMEPQDFNSSKIRQLNFNPNESRRSINILKNKDRMMESQSMVDSISNRLSMESRSQNQEQSKIRPPRIHHIKSIKDEVPPELTQLANNYRSQHSQINPQHPWRQESYGNNPTTIIETEVEESRIFEPTSRISMDSNPLMDQSLFMEFVCPVCYDSVVSTTEIKVIHDDHKLCFNCLQSWIKVKFNSGQWNLKYFMCPISIPSQNLNSQCRHLIDPEMIRSVLSDEEFSALLLRAQQAGYVDLVCPWEECKASSCGMPPADGEGLKCPHCNREICMVCRDKSHGFGKGCPKRYEGIKEALQDERIGCCPECLEIFMKSEGCQHVRCVNCDIDFCFECSAPRDPIMNHGNHYHRVGCMQYCPFLDYNTKIENLENEYEPDMCEICREKKVSCRRPLNLQEFKKLAHLDFRK